MATRDLEWMIAEVACAHGEARRDKALDLEDALIANAQPLSAATLDAYDELFPLRSVVISLAEVEKNSIITLDAASGTKLVLWRGDVTRIGVDAIVNAANEAGLGCFAPTHRCVDNVIHRRSGPRLREACREEMANRPGGLWTQPICTPGFRIAAKQVLHVTGPRQEDAALLASCYRGCLDLAKEHGFKSLAFTCISTGLFGYPAEAAAKVALETTRAWLSENSSSLETVVFDVFTDENEAAYQAIMELQIASKWLGEARAVIICGGAGMSAFAEGQNVYTEEADFAAYYPELLPFGYRTAYQAMPIMSDERVPLGLRWGFRASHSLNMRHNFKPNDGYFALQQLLPKNAFVYTTNVDGCFERAGFPSVYTPQGGYCILQCALPCRRDAWWQGKEQLEAMLLAKDIDGVPSWAMPKCPYCGGPATANVRGGGYFTHAPHDDAQDRFIAWTKQNHDGLVVLEVGCGFNTPQLTRFLFENMARSSSSIKLIRVNPVHDQVSDDISAVGIKQPWSEQIAHALFSHSTRQEAGEADQFLQNNNDTTLLPQSTTTAASSPFFYDWRTMLRQLR